MSLMNDLLGKRPQPGPAPLSESEQQLLTEAEAVIGRYILSYRQVGKALAVIRDRQLFRGQFASFEDYVSEKWKMERAHAYRLIQAAGVSENLSPSGDTPARESQARPLAKLPATEQADAWQEAKAVAKTDQPPAAVVEQVVRKRKGKKGATKRKPIRLRLPGGTVIIEPNRAFTSAREILEHALRQVAGEQSAELVELESLAEQRRAA